MALFGTAGIRGLAETRVTPELALRVGRAAGQDAAGGEFVVARDGRVTGPALVYAVVAGLLSAGANVRTAGLLPTPALAYASNGRRGVMITASHNPPADNGIKLFHDGVEYNSAAEERIATLVDTHPEPVRWAEWGACESTTVLDSYRAAVVEYASGVREAHEGISVAVDCGNGMASLVTPHVLTDIGANVTTLNASVDGHFPGRASKPTAEAIRDLRRFVRDGAYPFGIAHDGDADRIVIVDRAGNLVHEDTVLAILADHYVRTATSDDPVVVTTPNASTRVDERVHAAGGRVERVRLGALHEGISEVQAAGGEVVFAAEPWKHIHPAFGGWIDGVVSAAILTQFIRAAGGIDVLTEPIDEQPYRKLSIDCPDPRKAQAMRAIESALVDVYPEAELKTEHGLRVELPDGSWFLIRPSGTEPYIRVYAEGPRVEALVDTARSVIVDAVDDATEGP